MGKIWNVMHESITFLYPETNLCRVSLQRTAFLQKHEKRLPHHLNPRCADKEGKNEIDCLIWFINLFSARLRIFTDKVQISLHKSVVLHQLTGKNAKKLRIGNMKS